MGAGAEGRRVESRAPLGAGSLIGIRENWPPRAQVGGDFRRMLLDISMKKSVNMAADEPFWGAGVALGSQVSRTPDLLCI